MILIGWNPAFLARSKTSRSSSRNSSGVVGKDRTALVSDFASPAGTATGSTAAGGAGASAVAVFVVASAFTIGMSLLSHSAHCIGVGAAGFGHFACSAWVSTYCRVREAFTILRLVFSS